ncbi:MAG TPA: M13 family metallopeptidase [Pirellulales bacterium]|nr:M13 family metallopeptidase [Pirellulales bacterium]
MLLVSGWAVLQAAETAPKKDHKSGIDRANFDPKVAATADFYEHVNGEWIAHNPIPPQYTRWGAFSELHDQSLAATHEILEGLVKETKPLAHDATNLRYFYQTAMDQAARDRQGLEPLEAGFAAIAKIRSTKDLLVELGHLHAAGVSAIFSFGIGQDEKLSSRYVTQLWQGGLSLPDRDYYLGRTEDGKKILAAYRAHVEKMLTLAGDSPKQAASAVEAIVKIETGLAEASRTPVQLRDREENYNKKSLPEMAALTPHLDWDVYLKSIGAPKFTDIIVGQPEFFAHVDKMLEDIAPADWQAYLRWHLLRANSAYLTAALDQERFHFYDETLRGAKEMQPLWKRAVGAIDRHLGQPLGKLYVEKYFPAASKQRMDELVKNILSALRDRIESRPWMSAATKKEAIAKLATVMTKIGYPDKWRDYTGLDLKADSYVANIRRVNEFDLHYDFNRLDKPVDRTEWGMTPPTVNAYYNSSMNEIVFPAGILQPPFFDPQADDAVNYGGIGCVIGHEITHGFDDQGSRSDAQGNLRNWWTAEDRSKFTKMTDDLVKQYDACVALDDLHVNGRLTLGENIADLGGIIISYTAYQKSLAGKPAPVIDGFTGAQRFFIGFAQVWRGETREAEARVRLRTDPHSPMKFRVLVPLSNVAPFYEAFGVKPGDKMYRAPADRVEIW